MDTMSKAREASIRRYAARTYRDNERQAAADALRDVLAELDRLRGQIEVRAEGADAAEAALARVTGDAMSKQLRREGITPHIASVAVTAIRDVVRDDRAETGDE